MKKASALLMALSLLLLSGCRWFRTQSEEPYTAFFDDAFLAECQLDDLPTPPTDDRRCYDHKLYFNLSEAEFESYADTIVTYLLENEDIYYQGYHYQTGCPGGIFFIVENRYKPLTADTDLDGYRFAFSTTEKLNEGDAYNRYYWNGITLSVSQAEGDIDTYHYNAVVTIDNDPGLILYYEE